jgi:ribosomal protein S15P/S13E
MPLNPELKANTIRDYATVEGDTGSTEVQIAIMELALTDAVEMHGSQLVSLKPDA